MCVLLVLLVVQCCAACVAGPEAASRVPAEFVVQHAEFANPPALLLTLERVLRKLAQPGQQLRALLDRAALENLFERVRAWTDWCVPCLLSLPTHIYPLAFQPCTCSVSTCIDNTNSTKVRVE